MRRVGVGAIATLATACAASVPAVEPAEPAAAPPAKFDPATDREIRATLGLPDDPGAPWRPAVPRAPLRARPVLTYAAPAVPDEPAVAWPLVRPPEMRPHLEVTADCAVGDDFAHRYAAAWCLIESGARAQAASRLTELVRAESGAPQAALVLDLAEVIADIEHGDRALVRLETAGLPREIWDVLIATYLENADVASAQLLAAAQPDDHAHAPVLCERVERNAKLATGSRARAWEVVLAGPAAPDCMPRFEERACAEAIADAWGTSPRGAADRVLRDCLGYSTHHPDFAATFALALASAAWPAPDRPWTDWAVAARHGKRALGVAGGAELAVSALENASYVSDCSANTILAIRTTARELRASSHLTADQRARLAPLEAFAPTCTGPGIWAGQGT